MKSIEALNGSMSRLHDAVMSKESDQVNRALGEVESMTSMYPLHDVGMVDLLNSEFDRLGQPTNDVIARIGVGEGSHHRIYQGTDGNSVIRCNGYIAVSNVDGFVAIHSASEHFEAALEPDPVEQVHPGYGNMSMTKSARAKVAASYDRDEDDNHPYNVFIRNKTDSWHMGITNSIEYSIGVSGGLIMQQPTEYGDILSRLLQDDRIAGVAELAEESIDRLAGFADQVLASHVRSLLSLGPDFTTTFGPEVLQYDLKRYIASGRNVN